MKYKIRRTFDIDCIKKLHKKIFPLDEWYDNKRSIYWLVTNDYGMHVGFCMAVPAMYNPEILFLSRAGLINSVLGKGLHKRMISVRDRYARRESFHGVVTYTSIDNIAPAINLQRMGYRLYYPASNYAGKMGEVLYWYKSLI